MPEEEPTSSWEGEQVVLSQLRDPKNRGPGYDTPKARRLRGEKGVINTPSQHLRLNVVVDNDK